MSEPKKGWAFYEARRNKEKRKAWRRAWSSKPENKEKKRIKSAKYRAANRDALRAKFKEYYANSRVEYNARSAARRKIRLATDPQYALSKNLRIRVYSALKRRGIKKSEKTNELVGCTIEFLKGYIESKFKPGMSWDNYRWDVWHIDHIKPCHAFDLTNKEDRKACFHYTNLQPLWAKENMIKNKKWEPIQ